MVRNGYYVWLKVLFGAIAMLAFVCLVSVSVATLESANKATTTLTVQSSTNTGNLKHEVDVGKEKLVYNPELDFNYMMSKRRVPNGPDPIHNRYITTQTFAR